MAKRVCVIARDLFFRAKLRAVVAAAGAAVAETDDCDAAVIEIGAPDAAARISAWVARGTPVLAFGSHVQPDALREARSLGARAVPNSQVEDALRQLLA